LASFQSCSNSNEVHSEIGEVIRLDNFKSNYVSSRHIDVWLPEEYSDTVKHQVIYMHDGQMLFDPTNTWNNAEWKADEVCSSLISREFISPTIIVGIHNAGDQRDSEYFPQKPFESLTEAQQNQIISFNAAGSEKQRFSTPINSDNYLKFIVEELKPHIDQKFNTDSSLEATSIAGSSMGGLISMYALCEYPEVFSKAGCISTHWIGINTPEVNPAPQAFVDYLKSNLPDGRTHKIYFDYGTESLDAQYEPSQKLVDSILKISDWPESSWKTMKFYGADHSENSWSDRLQFPFTFLLSDNDALPYSPELTLEQANKLATLPLECMQTEYPNKLGQVLGNDEDLGSPKDLHPAFYGCFDWHSA